MESERTLSNSVKKSVQNMRIANPSVGLLFTTEDGVVLMRIQSTSMIKSKISFSVSNLSLAMEMVQVEFFRYGFVGELTK